MTEKLTDVQRAMLIAGGHNTALRIIDAHASDRAALVAQVAELTRERDEARVQRDEAAVSRDRTRDDFVSELQRNTAAAETEVARLKDALAAAEQRIAGQRDQIRQLRIAIYELFQRAEAAESRAAPTRTEGEAKS